MDNTSQPSQSSNRSWLRIGLILVWLMIVLTFYFVIHKPAAPDQIAGVAAWLPSLTITGLIIIVASMLGYRLLG